MRMISSKMAIEMQLWVDVASLEPKHNPLNMIYLAVHHVPIKTSKTSVQHYTH